MKHLLCYFSATGNTLDAAKTIKATLEARGHTADLFDIEGQGQMRGDRRNRRIQAEELAGEIVSCDTLVLLFPVYSWSPPALVLRFVRRLPRGNAGATSRPAAVVAVDGDDGLRAAARAKRALQGRGYGVFLSARVGYPDNWTQMMEPPDSEEAAREIETGEQEARRVGEDIAQRWESHYRPKGLGPLLLAAIGAGFRILGRRLLGQFYAANNACTTCRLCARTCPVGAITIPSGRKARPGWNLRCESCNRCINICPEGAIVTSPGRMILIIASIAVMAYLMVVGMDRFLAPEPGPARNGLIVAAIVVSHVLYFFIPAPVYRLVYRVPGLRRLLSAGFNRTWRRYRFPGYQPRCHLPSWYNPPGGKR